MGSGMRNLSTFNHEANVMKSVQVFIEEEDTTGVCELAVSKPFTRKPRTPAPRKAGHAVDKRHLAFCTHDVGILSFWIAGMPGRGAV